MFGNERQRHEEVEAICPFPRQGSFPFFDGAIFKNVDIFVGMIA